MKLFGTFLLEQGLISRSDLLRALVEQAEALPSLPRAIFELKLYPPDTQLDIFAYQATHFKDYRTACLEMGIWDEASNAHALGRYFISRLKSLGEILVTHGCLSTEDLAHALRDYVALEEIVAPPVADAGPAIKLVRSDTHHRAAPLKGFSVPHVASAEDKKLFYVYCQYFDSDKLMFLEERIQERSGMERRILAHEFRALQTASKFINAVNSSRLLARLRRAVMQDKIWLEPNVQLLRQALQILWEVRESIAEGRSELEVMVASSIESRMRELGFAIESLNVEMGSHGTE